MVHGLSGNACIESAPPASTAVPAEAAEELQLQMSEELADAVSGEDKADTVLPGKAILLSEAPQPQPEQEADAIGDPTQTGHQVCDEVQQILLHASINVYKNWHD